MRPTFSVHDVRLAEAELLQYQRHEDELMRLAAQAVASAAHTMVGACPARALILAGPGGNGGDGLYAGAYLQESGVSADALLVAGDAHESALRYWHNAGGTLIKDALEVDFSAYDLVIDAVAGLNSSRGLNAELARALHSYSGQVLAVDMPTGVHGETGFVSENAVRADVTITFGWPRSGHAVAAECGLLVVSDLRLPAGPVSFAEHLSANFQPTGYIAYEPTLNSPYDWPAAPLREGASGVVTAPKPVGCTGPIVDPTPGIDADKYSGGVVALCAGNATFPGAGYLALAGAINASPSMVRMVRAPEGHNLAHLVSSFPEAVFHHDVRSTGRAQAWVHGPGRGTAARAAHELSQVLNHQTAVVLDADAITLLADSPDLRQQVKKHPFVVLTPHGGEFTRLYEATFGYSPNLESGRGANQHMLADELDCYILHKGRITTVTAPGAGIYGFNAGHSYAATAGSGDVLSGILGAVLAQIPWEEAGDLAGIDKQLIISEILHAAAIHQHAAAIAARTPAGMGIARARDIARCVPEAIARLLVMER